MDSLLLKLLAPKRLGVSCESPNLVEPTTKSSEVLNYYKSGIILALSSTGILRQKDQCICIPRFN